MNWSIFGRFELYRIVRCWTVNRYIIHSLMLHLIFCMDKLTLRSSLVCVCVFHLSASYDSSNDPLGALKKQRQFCQINGWGPLGSRSALRIGDFRHFLAAIFPMIRKKEGVRVKRNWGKGTGEVKFGFLLWMLIQSLL